jgi:hypothetical protein
MKTWKQPRQWKRRRVDPGEYAALSLPDPEQSVQEGCRNRFLEVRDPRHGLREFVAVEQLGRWYWYENMSQAIYVK